MSQNATSSVETSAAPSTFLYFSITGCAAWWLTVSRSPFTAAHAFAP
jgi:hypothetical protein